MPISPPRPRCRAMVSPWVRRMTHPRRSTSNTLRDGAGPNDDQQRVAGTHLGDPWDLFGAHSVAPRGSPPWSPRQRAAGRLR